MKKRIRSIACAVLISVMTLQSVNVFANEDLLYEQKEAQTLTDGVKYEKSQRLYKAGWMDVYVLTIDTNNENVAFDILESKTEYGLKQSMLTMAKDNGALAAVNADFFGSGNPQSSMGQVVKDGEMVATQNYYNGSENKYAGFFIDNENVPFIDYIKSTVGFYNSATAVITVGAKNKVNGFKTPVYFDINAFKDTRDLDKRYSNLTKIVVENDVIAQISNPGQIVVIPDNGYIIVMNDATRQEKISNYAVGQGVSFNENESFAFRPQKSISNVKLGVSGGGELLRNGSIVNTGLIIGEKARNPRTMIGVNQDKSKVIIACIDGRRNGIGATHTEAAGIMKEYGAWDAIHFDGGGSTTMVAKEENHRDVAVVNTPSEGSLRLVANGIGVKSTNQAQAVSTLNVLVSNSKNNYLFNGVGFEMEVYGYDANHNITDINPSKLEYSSTIEGTWVGNKFTPAEEGDGTIMVKYMDGENVQAEGSVGIRVLKGASNINATVNTNVLVAGQSTQLHASMLNSDGYSVALDNDDIVWTVDNSEIGYVNEEGYFVATGNGIAKITARNNGVSDEVAVSVGKTETAVMNFEGVRNMIMYYFPADDGITGGAGINANEKIEGNSSLQLNYNFKPDKTTTQVTYVSFENQQIAMPDKATDLKLWFKGDGKGNQLKAVIKDANQKTYNLLLSQAMDTAEWTEATAEIPKEVVYPITLDKIYVAALSTTTTNATGTVYIDKVTALSPMSEVVIDKKLFNDYMKRDLSGEKVAGEEDITIFGQTKTAMPVAEGADPEAAAAAKEVLMNNILSQMSVGARAMVFVGASEFNNTTGVTSVAWNNTYYTTGTDNVSIVNLASSNGSIRSSSPNQWRWLQGYLAGYSKQNLVINLDKNIWGSGSNSLNDGRERDLLHKLLSEYVVETGKNVMVVSASGTANSTTVKDGVRYVNLSGLNSTNGYSYLKLRADGDSMYYQLVNIVN